jgi:membrane-bound lytic murein transglycosylase
MKYKILIFIFLLSFGITNGQEIKLNSAVVATAGNSNVQNAINISKWRLGEVHLVILQQDELTDFEAGWKINSYPNPFRNFLNLKFQMEEQGEFSVQVTGMTGTKIWFEKKITALPGQVIQIDLAHLAQGMYLVAVTPQNEKVQQIIKVQKY